MNPNDNSNSQLVGKYFAIFFIVAIICATAINISKRIGPLGIDIRVTFDFGELVKKEK